MRERSPVAMSRRTTVVLAIALSALMATLFFANCSTHESPKLPGDTRGTPDARLPLPPHSSRDRPRAQTPELPLDSSAPGVAASAAGGEISGEVHDGEGAVVPDATVEAPGVNDARSVARTDTRGRFRLTAVRVGIVTLRCYPGDVGSAERAFVGTSLDVNVGTAPISIEVSRGAHIAGRVTSEVGAGVAAEVEASTDSHSIAVVRSDSSGRYFVGGISADVVSLVAVPLAADDRYGLGIARLTARVSSARELDLVLTTRGTIRGRLVDQRGLPAQNITVVAIPVLESGIPAQSATLRPSDSEGRFLVHGVSEATRYLLTTTDPRQWLEAVVVGGGAVDVSVTVRDGVAFRGRVSHDGTGVAGARVSLREYKSEVPLAETGTVEDGVFVIGGDLTEDGRYTVTARDGSRAASRENLDRALSGQFIELRLE